MSTVSTNDPALESEPQPSSDIFGCQFMLLLCAIVMLLIIVLCIYLGLLSGTGSQSEIHDLENTGAKRDKMPGKIVLRTTKPDYESNDESPSATTTKYTTTVSRKKTSKRPASAPETLNKQGCGKKSLSLSQRSYNGKKATLGQFPWAVYLKFADSSYCSGSILTPRWIITASHCVFDHIQEGDEDPEDEDPDGDGSDDNEDPDEENKGDPDDEDSETNGSDDNDDNDRYLKKKYKRDRKPRRKPENSTDENNRYLNKKHKRDRKPRRKPKNSTKLRKRNNDDDEEEDEEYRKIPNLHFKIHAAYSKDEENKYHQERIGILAVTPLFEGHTEVHIDMSLVKLNKPFKFNKYIKPICVRKTSALSNPKKYVCEQAGYGDPKHGIRYFLGNIEIEPPHAKRCKKNLDNDEDYLLCAIYNHRKQITGTGDSGGPLTCIDKKFAKDSNAEWTLVGTLMHEVESVDYYVNAEYFYNWIKKVIETNKAPKDSFAYYFKDGEDIQPGEAFQ